MSSAVKIECDAMTDARLSAVRDAVTTTVSLSGATSSRKSAVAPPPASAVRSVAAAANPSSRAVTR